MPYLICQNSSENPTHTYTLSSMGSSYLEKCLCSLNLHLGCGLNFPWRITLCKRHLSASTPVLHLKTSLETMFHGAQFEDVWQAHILAVFHCHVQTDALTSMVTYCRSVYSLTDWVMWNGADDAFSHWWLLHTSGVEAQMFLFRSDCILIALFLWSS